MGRRRLYLEGLEEELVETRYRAETYSGQMAGRARRAIPWFERAIAEARSRIPASHHERTTR